MKGYMPIYRRPNPSLEKLAIADERPTQIPHSQYLTPELLTNQSGHDKPSSNLIRCAPQLTISGIDKLEAPLSLCWLDLLMPS